MIMFLVPKQTLGATLLLLSLTITPLKLEISNKMKTLSISIFLLLASGKKAYDFETSFIDKNVSILFLFSRTVMLLRQCVAVRT